MIKAILFDMVGVLLQPCPISPNSEKVKQNIKAVEGLYNHIDDDKLRQDIKDKLHLSREELDEVFHKMPLNYERFDPLWKLLPRLKTKYKLAVVNNGNALALPHWKEYFDFSMFDLFINSAEVGVKKPDPKIYHLTCTRLGVSPTECLYFDDDTTYIEKANELGIESFWWDKDNPPLAKLIKL